MVIYLFFYLLYTVFCQFYDTISYIYILYFFENVKLSFSCFPFLFNRFVNLSVNGLFYVLIDCTYTFL